MMNCTVFYKEIADKSNKINAEEHKSHYKERIAAYHHKKAGIKRGAWKRTDAVLSSYPERSR